MFFCMVVQSGRRRSGEVEGKRVVLGMVVQNGRRRSGEVEGKRVVFVWWYRVAGEDRVRYRGNGLFFAGCVLPFSSLYGVYVFRMRDATRVLVLP